jgi:hypothetical protein
MNSPAPPLVDEALWSGALLSADTELLLGAARNYLGPVRTPYDKREIVGRLAAFLRRPDVRRAVLDLLDDLDARILGSFFLLGPVPEMELRSLFEGEIPLFDLGIRLANLEDRLLLFRFEQGGRRLLAPNPILAEDLAAVVLDPERIFGVGGDKQAEGAAGGNLAGGPEAGPSAPVCAADAVALFAFLFHSPGGIRKGGGLTKKAQEKALALLPEGARAPGERLPALLSAFEAAGFLGPGTSASGIEGREADLSAFSAALGSWGEMLPAHLAAAMAMGADPGGEAFPDGASALREGSAALVAALSSVPPGFVFSPGGLNRLLAIGLRRKELGSLASRRRDLVEAMVDLGLVADSGAGCVVRLPWPALATEAPATGLVAEGSHALHLLPEASLGARLIVSVLAKPVAFGTVWSLEIDRESARRAFAAGLDAKTAIARLTALAGRPLPQSLTFSLEAWEEEYRSLRLYRGFVLVADDRLRPIIERSRALAPRIAERLAPGVYVLAVSGPEEAAELIEEAGLEAPPETHYGHARPARVFADGTEGEAGIMPAQGRTAAEGGEGAGFDFGPSPDPYRHHGGRPAAEAPSPFAVLSDAAQRSAVQRGAGDGAVTEVPARLDPRPRLEMLSAALDAAAFGVEDVADYVAGEGRAAASQGPAASKVSTRSAAELRELSDRIQRRLILTTRQLVAAEVRPERLEASGLDYLGKVRIVERALRGSGDRLEILYRLPGAEPARALLRPVRLEKTEKGLVLEAEDLATGSPLRIPFGAMSSVRMMRASLFGVDP